MVELLKCMCGARGRFCPDWVECENQNCSTSGPSNDPTGEKWNALMAPHQPATEPKPGTVRQSFAVWQNSDGSIGRVGTEQYADLVHARPDLWITAELPIPQPAEIAGTVEGGGDG